MSKVKKILAMLMAVVMTLGMCVTAFAAESVKIVVNNLEDGTTVQVLQVIEPSTSSETGWSFCTETIRNAYVKALLGKVDSVTDQDGQKAIWMLLLAESKDLADKAEALNIKIPEGTEAATTEQIKTALDNVQNEVGWTNTDSDTNNEFTVTSAGVYAIKATPKQGSDTVYNPMAAYVAFTYSETGVPALPETNVEVNAKKTEVPVEKSVKDDDLATGIGETVTYEVKTAIPYGVSTWKFTDKITNASYVVVPEGEQHAGTVEVGVTIGTEEEVYEYATVSGSTFELDLSKYVTSDNYGKEVSLTYDAIVTGLEVSNTIEYPDHKSNEVKLYTGSITFTKTDDDKENKLGGAGFKVSRTKGGKTEYATFSGSSPEYQLTGWVSDIANATEVFTNNIKGDTYGTLTVKGLDWGTYHFTETTAPEGYTINEKGEDVKFDAFLDGKATAQFTKDGSMADTKLSSLPLPSTGGIGTTLFTVGGCTIMIVAAGLFFATRKKTEK